MFVLIVHISMYSYHISMQLVSHSIVRTKEDIVVYPSGGLLGFQGVGLVAILVESVTTKFVLGSSWGEGRKKSAQ